MIPLIILSLVIIWIACAACWLALLRYVRGQSVEPVVIPIVGLFISGVAVLLIALASR